MKKLFALCLAAVLVSSSLIGCEMNERDRDRDRDRDDNDDGYATSEPLYSEEEVEELRAPLIEAYADIVKRRNENGNMKGIEREDYPDVSEDAFSTLYAAAVNGKGGVIGYTERDLNSDGVPEMILIDRNYAIYSILTIKDGEYVGILNGGAAFANRQIAIDSHNRIFFEGYSRGESTYRYILELDGEGRLCGKMFGHYDQTGFGDPDVYNCLLIYDAEHPYCVSGPQTATRQRISDEELDELVREYNKLCRENYEGDEKYFTIQKVTESANFDIKYVIEVGQPK